MAEHSVEELRRRLDEARARRVQSPRAQWRAAHDEVLAAERQLAEAEGVEYADEVDSNLDCDGGAPLPHIVATGRGVWLAYYLRRPPPPNWRGRSVEVVTSATAAPIAVLAFDSFTVRVSGPNNEAMSGHPLSRRGLTPYSLLQVRRSRWIAELEEQNTVHPRHRGGWAERTNHYLFQFHDEMFQCIAPSYSAEVRYDSMAEVVRELALRCLI
jgi:hypothetical protein